MFVFGDSLSDTGNSIAAFPSQFESEHFPYGSTFFHTPTGRYSDGRLIIDFLASRWGLPFLEPYFKNVDPNYKHGINFAVSGATARNDTIVVPFYLPLQIDQFIQFKQRVFASLKSKKDDVSHVPTPAAIKDGIYVISIGMMDMLYGTFSEGNSLPDVKKKIVLPMIVAISKAIADLHKEGAKNFMVFSIMPVGCTPLVLALASKGSYGPRDKLGCLRDVNEIVDFANHELAKSLRVLNHQYKGTKIQIADINRFTLSAMANPRQYGLKDTEKFKACCGHGGGAYNYDSHAVCGFNPAAKACTNPGEHINWDSLHYTDAFSQQFVEELMKGLPFLKHVHN